MLSIRRWIQISATLLCNAYWLFPFSRHIYLGHLKSLCVPGLNCYSCPAAAGACPIGAIQTFMASVRPNFKAGSQHLGLYVIGMLGFIGSIVGRMPCGWVCPFGFLQELLYKIPSPKFGVPKILTHMKYVFLGFLVFILPLTAVDEFGYGMTWFCKFICPAGSLEAGIPMILLKPELRHATGLLYISKVTILALFIVWMVLSRRPFCRTTCPLGAVYSLFNRHSIFRMTHDPEKCTRCEACYADCPMGIKFYEGANQHDCIRCLRCLRKSCQFGAISCEVAGAGIPISLMNTHLNSKSG